MAFIEKKWMYKGFQCSVVFTEMGIRCGYVVVPASLKIKKDAEGYVKINMHGGCTFDEKNRVQGSIRREVCGMMINSKSRVIGFDCGHAWDSIDFDKFEHRFPKDYDIFGELLKRVHSTGEFRSLQYCERECRYIVDQIKQSECE